MENLWLSYAKRLLSIAETGLAYAKDKYDKERHSGTIPRLSAGRYLMNPIELGFYPLDMDCEVLDFFFECCGDLDLWLDENGWFAGSATMGCGTYNTCCRPY